MSVQRSANFIDDLSGWKYYARAATREQAPANRHGRLPSVRVNGRVLPESATQVFLLEQEVAVDATERGYYSVTVDYLVESVGAGFTNITLVATPATSNDQQFNLRLQAGAPISVWRRERLRVLLPEPATSVKFGVNSQQGARAAIVRLAKIRLHPDLQTEAGGYTNLNEELGGAGRESARIENLKSGAGPSSARPVCRSSSVGMQFYDTTLATPLWCDGRVWRLATGAVAP